ncbi:uncharacterized protein LOC133825739 [Humulus lupulus]|uniref:uncharacterized protein LOC133825739 n=1 Tax=Humulus lupulus TaxID=3486 RepID=UPI002B412967|nr:uncharacterized protein LOC133825739 [Humulus lupulus]
MSANDPNIPEEEILDEDDYPQCPGKQPMAEATKRNEELARLATEAQVAQAPPSQDTQSPPPRDAQVPPRRPKRQPRKNAAARRAEQAPPPASHPVPPRPRRSNRAEGAANPTLEAQVGIGNNRAPSVARTQNPGATQNVPEPDRVNSGPSRPHNGRHPPSLIRHPTSPIRHHLPVRRDPRPAHQDRDSLAGHRHGKKRSCSRV